MKRRVVMKVLPLFLGTASALSPSLVRAATIYDIVDVDPLAFNAGWDPVSPTMAGPNAASFLVASTEILSSVSLEPSASNPNDGGSLTIVLMPDNNGWPHYQTALYADLTRTRGITTFTDDTVLATILDSALSPTASPSPVTISTSVVLSPEIYWIGIETPPLPSSVLAGDTPDQGTYGSAEWWWTDDNPAGAIGGTDQLDFNAGGGPSPFPISGGGALVSYEMILDTAEAAPNPATSAILCGGLAGLGYVRRRTAKKGRKRFGKTPPGRSPAIRLHRPPPDGH
jgi:hypothetical protein